MGFFSGLSLLSKNHVSGLSVPPGCSGLLPLPWSSEETAETSNLILKLALNSLPVHLFAAYPNGLDEVLISEFSYCVFCGLGGPKLAKRERPYFIFLGELS